MLRSSGQLLRAAPSGRVRPALEALEVRCVPSNSVTFLGKDTITQGSWQGAYGGSGYQIVGDATSLPGDTKLTVSGASTYVYANPTDDLRGLQKAATPTTRVEACWFNYVFGQTTNSSCVEVKLPSGRAGTQVSFYVQDWVGGGRAETITALDGQTGATLDTESVSNIRNGVYLSWNQQGDVVYQFTRPAVTVHGTRVTGVQAAKAEAMGESGVPSRLAGRGEDRHGTEGRWSGSGAISCTNRPFRRRQGSAGGTKQGAASEAEARTRVRP